METRGCQPLVPEVISRLQALTSDLQAHTSKVLPLTSDPQASTSNPQLWISRIYPLTSKPLSPEIPYSRLSNFTNGINARLTAIRPPMMTNKYLNESPLRLEKLSRNIPLSTGMTNPNGNMIRLETEK
jgi:hypothetical protein